MKVALINMPFAMPETPSIALTQLRSRISQTMGPRVETTIRYLNHDFVGYFGLETYQWLCGSMEALVTGLGDWLFRGVAFPEASDNQREYLGRYIHQLKDCSGSLEEMELLRKNLGAFLDGLIDRDHLDGFDVVGFTSMFGQNVPSFALSRKIKERRPETIVVMGGANCESPMGAAIVRNVPSVDYVFSGPGLKAFPRFLECLREGKLSACEQIPGVLSRNKADTASAADEIGEELDIDEEVPLDYEDFILSLERRCASVRPEVAFETSRGCWWGQKAHCTFCGLNGTTMAYRSMSEGKALKLLHSMFQYHPRVSTFRAVDNILPREYLTTVLPRLQPPDGSSLFYEVKADMTEPELKILKQARVTEIQPGIEALATSTLRLMRKGTNAFQNLSFLKGCVTQGIRPHWNLLIGFPGEEERVFEKYVADLPSLFHLPPPSGVHNVRFDRFSPYHTAAKEYGLELQPYDFYAMVYPFPEVDLQRIAYYFADQKFDNPYIGAAARWLKRLEAPVERWKAAWSGEAGGSAPSLRLERVGGRSTIVDTRYGEREEHPVHETEVRLLATMARKPIGASHETAESLQTSPTELTGLLDRFKRRRWIFEEGERYLSLVL